MSQIVLDELRQIAGGEKNNISLRAMLRLVIAGLVEISDGAKKTNAELHEVTDSLMETQKAIDIIKRYRADIETLKANPFVRLGILINRYPKRTFVIGFFVLLILMFLPTMVVGIAQLMGVPLELVQFVFRVP